MEDTTTNVIINNVLYKIWKVPSIKPLVIKYIRNIYPDGLIILELDKIDVTLFNTKSNEIIPIEIQKTQAQKNIFSHADFEDMIRRQLNYNIKYYKKCWFFMDSEYVRYLQSGDIKLNSSMDMEWFVELMKEEKLKVFSIKYDGVVKELTVKDFDFIKITEDQILLNINKLNIYINVIFGYDYSQYEIDNLYIQLPKENKNDACGFFRKSDNERCKLYGNILSAIGNLPTINDTLNMQHKYDKHNRVKQNLMHLGLFENVGRCGSGNIIKFVDKFNIAKYFPGYIRNKKQWDNYRNNNLSHDTFIIIVNGRLKYNKTMMDF